MFLSGSPEIRYAVLFIMIHLLCLLFFSFLKNTDLQAKQLKTNSWLSAKNILKLNDSSIAPIWILADIHMQSYRWDVE